MKMLPGQLWYVLFDLTACYHRPSIYDHWNNYAKLHKVYSI